MTTTTTTETTVATLSAIDLKALRQADSICFDHGAESGIRAIKRGKAPFRQDITYTIRCRSSVRIHDDSLDYGQRNGDGAQCFAMIHSAQYDEQWRTIVDLLHVGDTLTLAWVGGDNNGYVTRSRVTEKESDGYSPGLGEKLYHDKLFLIAMRGKRKLSFYVADSICPNNTARMIRSL